MVFSRLAKASSRQKDVVEVVLRNGWDYMRRLLAGGKAGEPELPPPAVLRNILIDLGPVYVKLGQLLSTRPDLLPAAYIDALTALQAGVPPVPWSAVREVLQESLRLSFERAFAELQPEAIAAGSIAQVHRGRLPDGREVAVKIQRPGIREIVEQDVQLIRSLAELAMLTDLGNSYDLLVLADEFGEALRGELNFAGEASNTDRLRRNLSNSRWFESERLKIPEIIWDLTTEKVLVMEWLHGTPILKADFPAASETAARDRKKQLATLVTRAFFQQIYVDGFFHADPHPGNIFLLEDGRLALLDCGAIGRLDPRTQQLLTELLLAIVNLDAQRCAQLSLELSGTSDTDNLAKLEGDYDRFLRRYYNTSLSEVKFSQLVYGVLQISRENNVRLPSNIGLYFKTIANLEGIARELDPDYNLPEQVKPLVSDLFQRQLVGDAAVQDLLRVALDLKSLTVRSPRQIEVFLDRLTSETLRWNLTLRDLDGLRRSTDASANRLSFSIVVGSLIVGAAIIFSEEQSSQLFVASSALFVAASLLGLWLIVSVLRSGWR